MSTKSLTIAIVAVLSIPTIMSGCSSRNSLVRQGIASVEARPSKKVEILWTDVYKDGEETIVYGALRRRSHTSHPLKTHVVATVLTPDGKVVREAQTPDIYVPRFLPGKGVNFRRFEIRFPNVQGNFTVQVVVYSG